MTPTASRWGPGVWRLPGAQLENIQREIRPSLTPDTRRSTIPPPQKDLVQIRCRARGRTPPARPSPDRPRSCRAGFGASSPSSRRMPAPIARAPARGRHLSPFAHDSADSASSARRAWPRSHDRPSAAEAGRQARGRVRLGPRGSAAAAGAAGEVCTGVHEHASACSLRTPACAMFCAQSVHAVGGAGGARSRRARRRPRGQDQDGRPHAPDHAGSARAAAQARRCAIVRYCALSSMSA